MRILNLKIGAIGTLLFITTATFCHAQQGAVTLNQDKKIGVLLNLKKEMNESEKSSDHYKIQIYSGNRSGAESAKKEFHSSFTDWKSNLTFETPNYKIYIGGFRTRLEADRAFKRIKRKFPNAFII